MKTVGNTELTCILEEVKIIADCEPVCYAPANNKRNNAMVRKSPEPQALLRTFADSSIHFELLAWAIRPHDRGLLIHDLSKAISRRFNEKGVVIAFPQRDVHLRHINEE